jgi:hypothetical protein
MRRSDEYAFTAADVSPLTSIVRTALARDQALEPTHEAAVALAARLRK